jgi:surface protein
MKTNSYKPITTRIQSFFLMFLLMFTLSVTSASSKKIACAYLDITFRQLNFDYLEESSVKSKENDKSYRVWKGEEVTKSSDNPGWLSYSNSISTVVILNDFKEVKPSYTDHWFDGLNQVTMFWGLENLNTSETLNMECMFRNCESVTELNLSSFNTSKVTSFTQMFKGCKSLTKLNTSSFDTSNAIYMNAMFMQCEKLTSLSLTNFNTQNVTSFREMFRECKSLTYVNLSSFRTMKVKYMRYMFDECSSLTSIDLSNFNTSNVETMDCMFYMCTKLESLDLSNFDTHNVTSMALMFANCLSLKELNINGFNTANVTDMKGMFQGCTDLRSLNLASFNTSNVTDMSGMFNCCISLKSLDVSSFDVSKVTNMDYMFYSCQALRIIICPNTWTTGSSEYMFGDNPNLVGAIKFQSSKTTVAYANPNSGYFTRPKYYNLWVCGEQVSNANDFDLSQIPGVDVYDKGYATFDAQSQTLKLKNVSISAYDNCAIQSRIDGLTIQVDDNGAEEEFGSAVIFTALSKGNSYATLFLQNNTTITGTGGMTVISMPRTYDAEISTAIRPEKSLVFDNAKVAASGMNGIHGALDAVHMNGIHSMFKGSLTVKGKSTCLQFTSSNGDVVGLNSITFEDGNRVLGNTCLGIYKNDTYGYYIGDLCATMQPVTKSTVDNPLTIGLGYGIYVNGVQVTSTNCNKLNKIEGVTMSDDGEFRYDPATSTLYMKKVNITSSDENIPLVLWEGDMTLKVMEGNTLGCNWLIASQAKYALKISHRTKIKGDRNLLKNNDGILYALGGTESAVFIDNQARVYIEDAALYAFSSGKGITGNNSNITMELKGTSVVKANGTDICFSGINRLYLNNHKIVEPEGAEYTYDYQTKVSSVSLNGEPVKNQTVSIVYNNPYDVNIDGEVDISDVVAVINTMAGSTTYKNTADVNGDNNVNISDVVAIINYMAGK